MIEIDVARDLNLSLEQFNFLMSLTANLIGFSLLLIVILITTK